MNLKDSGRDLKIAATEIPFPEAGHAIRIINRDFTIRRINQAFAELSGVSPEEARGKKCWEFFPGPSCHTPQCRVNRICNGEEIVQVEIDRPSRDGVKVPCIVTAVPLYLDSQIVGVIEIFRDITE